MGPCFRAEGIESRRFSGNLTSPQSTPHEGLSLCVKERGFLRKPTRDSVGSRRCTETPAYPLGRAFEEDVSTPRLKT